MKLDTRKFYIDTYWQERVGEEIQVENAAEEELEAQLVQQEQQVQIFEYFADVSALDLEMHWLQDCF